MLYNLSRRGRPSAGCCRGAGISAHPDDGLLADRPGRRSSDNDVVLAIAQKHGATPAQVALAWVLRQDDVCAIPKAAIHEHVRENAGALALRLDSEDLRLLDEEFPAPREPAPLTIY